MPFLRRNELSWNERFRRCLYFFLRDELDSLLITEALIEPYKTFKSGKKEYPFVEMRELKPRAKIHGPEYTEQRAFIVIACLLETALVVVETAQIAHPAALVSAVANGAPDG